jgi:adenylate kinase
MKAIILVLTGVPGTGKDTIAKQLAVQGFRWISINQLVKEKKLWKKKEKGCLTVDLKMLEKELRKETSNSHGKNIVVDGHLACEIPIKSNLCIVLRTNPDVLRKRLEKRGYPKKKTEDNVMCEELDYCTQKAEMNIKCPIYEVRTDKKIKETMNDVKLILNSKGKRFKVGWIDWSNCLLGKPSKRKEI